MKAYLLSAVGVIFLSVVISLLVPEGKLKKSVTFIMRLICILVLIQPVTGIFKLPDVSQDTGYLDYEYVCSVYSDHQSVELEKLIAEKFVKGCECSVTVEHDGKDFKVTSATVEVPEENEKIIAEIYEYLKGLNYINITVYAKSS